MTPPRDEAGEAESWLGSARVTAKPSDHPGNAVHRRLRLAGRWAVLAAAVVLTWPGRTESTTSLFLPAISPFAALGSVVAVRTIGTLVLLALPVVLLAVLFPRGFCRYGCPAGLLQEIVERLRCTAPRFSARVPEFGKVLVALTLGGAVLGYPLFLWLDPLALFNGFLNAWRPPLATTSLTAGLGLPLLLLLNWVFPRVWCQRLCPLGATQDLLVWLRQWGRQPVRHPRQEARALPHHSRFAVARRGFLTGCVGAAGALAVRTVKGRTPPPLRPPGSVAEDRFTGVCIRCGNCAQACPSRVIQPDFGASGVAGWLTPHLRFEDDYCRESCHQCGRVCPSGAIRRLPLSEKRRQVIGPAEVDQDTCLLVNGRECTACLKRCPYEALLLHSSDGGFTSEPRVDLSKCTGCGACEAVCPVRPRRAIRVVPQPGRLV